MAEPRESDGEGTPAWLADDASIEVDVSRLEEYGKHVQGEALAFGENLKQAIQKLATHNVPFGGGGLAEGASFRGINDLNKGAATQLLGDVAKSLMAISSASLSIAEEYGSGDALSKATSDNIYAAFNGIAGKKMLTDLTGGGEAASGEQQGPQDKGGNEPRDASTDSVSGGSGVDQHKDDGEVVIGEPGSPGDYVVPADSEHVKSVPTDVASANDGKPIILAPGAPGGSTSSSGTVA
jgi:hypothetical protein